MSVNWNQSSKQKHSYVFKRNENLDSNTVKKRSHYDAFYNKGVVQNSVLRCVCALPVIEVREKYL